MSPRDLPLWARAAAAGLLIVASWWLVRTETIRVAVGGSAALLSLGIVAGFILRGMHLPLDLWPRGAWRSSFATAAVVAIALAFAVPLVLTRPARVAELVVLLDRGVVAMVTVGVIVWGFAWAFVRQRPYAGWYAIGTAAALAPLLVAALWLRVGGDAVLSNPLPWGDVVQVVVFAGVTGTAVSLVTEELAFRRLLIGEPTQAGLVVVVVAAAAAAAWHLVIGGSVGAGARAVWLGAAVAAFVVGPVYVLSKSLLVSALCNALIIGGLYALDLVNPVGVAAADGWRAAVAGVMRPALLTEAVLAAVLLALVARRNGVLTGLRPAGERHAPRD